MISPRKIDVLSAETVDSLKASLGALDRLLQDIFTLTKSDGAISKDPAVNGLYEFADNIHVALDGVDELDDVLLPSSVVEVLSQELAPPLAGIMTELQQLWVDIQRAVKDGTNSRSLYNDFVTKCQDEGSAVMRFESGRKKLQDALLDAVVDTLIS